MGQIKVAQRKERTIFQSIQGTLQSAKALGTTVECTHNILDRSLSESNASDFGGSAIVGCSTLVALDGFV